MQVYPSGTRIAGRYEVAGRPLMGGMGIVYLCFDHQEQRPVALKTFRPEYLPDRAARDRLLRSSGPACIPGHRSAPGKSRRNGCKTRKPSTGTMTLRSRWDGTLLCSF